MITRLRSWIALPGKAPELIAILKEISAAAAALHGREASPVAVSVGGDLGEVTLIMSAASIEEQDDRVAKALADPTIAALVAKIPALIADSGYEQIYRHV
jgi:hypothetical protein